MSVHITAHAIDRYIERVAPVERAEAHSRIAAAGRAIEFAAAFGGHTVRLGSGAKLVIRGVGRVRVVTVLPRGWINRADVPKGGVVCCGGCGLRSSHPLARACTRVDCSLAARVTLEGCPQ